MMDWTDRHCRAFHRVLSRRARLYTEMVTTGAVLHGDRARLLGFDAAEHPVAVQLGGNDPRDLAASARICADLGYDEINLNVGCPSDRVQNGAFGACLMRVPTLVGDCVAAMKAAVAVPVTVKCRLGVDDQGSEALDQLADAVLASGADALVVHARKAWLQGLSPRENRDVPPLDYDAVYALKRRLPHVPVALNGGLASHENAMLSTPHAQFADFSPQTGVFTWIDTQRYRVASTAATRQDAKLPPLDLVQSRPGQCGAPQVVRAELSAEPLGEVVIDPWGRWIAEIRPIDDAKPGTPVARLVLSDLDSRRVVSSTPLAQAVRGLVATPDGATILALSLASDVLSFKVDVAALTTPKSTAGEWDATPCRIDDEAPGARAVARVTRALAPAWTMDHAAPANVAETPFVMRDGTLWLDLGATLAQVDPASGKTLRSLPTPRSDRVASVPVPASDGFFNWQGDTLSWRPFDAGAAGARAKRVVEARPGWTIEEVGTVGRNVRVVWQADQGTRVPNKTYGVPPDLVTEPQDLVVAFYDAASGRRVREFPGQSDAYGVVGDVSMPDWSPDWLGRCRDVQGAVTAGTDWRFDAFASLRATRCEPDGSRTTTAWFGLDIAPRVVGKRIDDAADRPTSADGGVAAALDDRRVRAFDIETRRELGQVMLRPTQRVTWLRVLGDRRLLLIETSDGDSLTGRPTLGAWSLK